MKTNLLLALAVLAAPAAGAHGSIIYLSQSRRVEVEAFTNVDLRTAFDFGTFNEACTVRYDDGFLGPCTASQRSDLLPDRIVAVGSISADDGNQGFAGFARSVLDVTFRVDTPMSFNLTGMWTTSYRGLSEPEAAHIRFENILDSSFRAAALPPVYADTFGVMGTLDPGVYRLEVDFAWRNAWFMGNAFSEDASYQVLLTVSQLPTPGAAGLLGLGMLAGSRRRR